MSLRLVADLVESPPTDTPYDDLKERHVASHQLSEFQKAERLIFNASSRWPEAFGDDGRHVGDLSAWRGEDEPVQLHFPASSTQGDQQRVL